MNREVAKSAKEEGFLGDRWSNAIIGAAIEVHRTLGPGLLESIYEDAMGVELTLRGVPFRRQVNVPIRYKGVSLGSALKMDLIVDEYIVLELKSVKALLPLHDAQLLTYMRLTGAHLGFIFNFNSAQLIDGMRRLVDSR